MKNKKTPATLIDKHRIRVRFSEVDSMHVVWHGSYIKYLEDGRESFGRRFGIGYTDVLSNGYSMPVVKLNCNYKSPLRYGDEAIVETHFINSNAAKILFEYYIYRAGDYSLVLDASSMQVFLNQADELELLSPAFFIDWKKRWAIM